MARVISKTQVSDPGPSWPSCFYKGPLSPARWLDKNTYLFSLGILGKTQLRFCFSLIT